MRTLFECPVCEQDESIEVCSESGGAYINEALCGCKLTDDQEVRLTEHAVSMWGDEALERARDHDGWMNA